MNFRHWKLIFAIAVCFGVQCCAPYEILENFPSAKGNGSETFGYRAWKRDNYNQDIVIIGIHGFSGASVDYENLGRYLVNRQPRTAIYAYEVRGQGSDPIHQRRGDIGSPEQWYTDLNAFTLLVKKRHPKAKIVWYGESMGALIATHAICSAPEGESPCDTLVLSSPIVRFKDDLEPWKIALVQVAAATLPLARIPLESLSDGEDVQMTQDSFHGEQAKTNPYNVEKHTLRLLGTLAKLINGMNDCASKIQVPVLVLHGDEDYFNNDSDMRGFIARLSPEISKTYHNYPGAYHLLMYDEKRRKIFRDVARWLDRQRHD